MDSMGYDAMALGQLDLALGIPRLLELAQDHSVRLLSCNVIDVAMGSPVFTPYTIIERGGLRFGILGVSELQALQLLPEDRDRYKVLDPTTVVAKWLPKARADSDIVILLSHLGLERDRELAQQVEGIHVIVGGRSKKVLSTPQRVGDTLILQAGFDGGWLGRLDVELEQGQLANAQETIIALEATIRSDPEIEALVQAYYQRRFARPSPTP